MEWKHEKSGKKSQSKLMSYLVRYNLLLYNYVDVTWFKFSFGAKFLKLVQYLFSFVLYLLP